MRVDVKLPYEMKNDEARSDFVCDVINNLARESNVRESLIRFLTKYEGMGIALFVENGEPYAGVFEIPNENCNNASE